MIDLIRQSAVPASIMRAASRGALSLPAPEMVEILVCLSAHRIFGQQAQLTLAGWDEESSRAIAADPQTPADVLKYMISPRNLRPRLLPALLENPAIPESRLAKIAGLKSRDIVEAVLASPRAMHSPEVLRALLDGGKLTPAESSRANALIEANGDSELAEVENDEVLEIELEAYLKEHADEINAAEGQPFYLHGWTLEEEREILPSLSGSGMTATSAAIHSMAFAAKAEVMKQANEKQSPIQKIMKMSVGDRVQLAIKGSKDERFILIRDGARVVCNAVVESPKVSDSEVEAYAAMKNVQESVLRVIASKRKFIKSYAVIRTLTANPRCPVDVSIPLMPHLLNMDLKNLSTNKNVADAVRKLAYKMFKDRTTKRE
jgi:hypothetical protein